MAGSKCTLCKRDLQRATLSRCRERRCPARPSNRRGSASIWIGGAIGLLILGSIVIGSWLLAGSGRRSAGTEEAETAAAAGAGAPARAGGSAGASVKHWFEKLVAAPSPTPAAPPAQPEESSLPDPRAGTRVITFSCNGVLSPSRSRICTDWTLATVDYNLSLFYRSVLARSRKPEAVRRINAARLARLDHVGTDSDVLLKYYADWREELARQ